MDSYESNAISPSSMRYLPDWKKRIALIATGHSFNAIFDHLYNYWLYIPAVAILGPLKGGIIMALGDVIISLAFIKFYDWAKVDWLGIETLKELLSVDTGEENTKKNVSLARKFLQWPYRAAAWSMKKGRFATFIVLSIMTDPFITTVALREVSYGEMRRRDWGIFFSSAILTNVWWTAQVYLMIILAKLGYEVL